MTKGDKIQIFETTYGYTLSKRIRTCVCGMFPRSFHQGSRESVRFQLHCRRGSVQFHFLIPVALLKKAIDELWVENSEVARNSEAGCTDYRVGTGNKVSRTHLGKDYRKGFKKQKIRELYEAFVNHRISLVSEWRFISWITALRRANDPGPKRLLKVWRRGIVNQSRCGGI